MSGASFMLHGDLSHRNGKATHNEVDMSQSKKKNSAGPTMQTPSHALNHSFRPITADEICNFFHTFQLHAKVQVFIAKEHALDLMLFNIRQNQLPSFLPALFVIRIDHETVKVAVGGRLLVFDRSKAPAKARPQPEDRKKTKKNTSENNVGRLSWCQQ